MTASHDRDRADRELMEGQRGAGACRHRLRLPVLRGLSDDSVHGTARTLRPPAPRGGRSVHQRRVRARSRRHGVGRARHRRPRRDGLDRPGPLAHAGVVLRAHARRAPARHLQHGARPAGLLPGDTRRWPRRLPPHRARAAGRTRRRAARAARVPPRRQVAQPGARLRRLPPRAHPRSVDDRRRDVRRTPRQGLGGRRARLGFRDSRKSVTPLGVAQARAARLRPRRKGAVHRDEDAAHGTRGPRRDRLHRRRGDGDRRVRLAGEVREVRDQGAARRRSPHRIRAADHACGRSRTTPCAPRRRRPGASAPSSSAPVR